MLEAPPVPPAEPPPPDVVETTPPDPSIPPAVPPLVSPPAPCDEPPLPVDPVPGPTPMGVSTVLSEEHAIHPKIEIQAAIQVCGARRICIVFEAITRHLRDP
jgi:hypothetical protein